MAEYIEREAAIERLEKLFQLQASTARAIIEAIPAADVAPVRRGRWGKTPTWWFYCSECGAEPPNETNVRTPFCPNCGAKMEVDDG